MIELVDVKTEYAYGDPFFFSGLRFEEGQISTVIGRNGEGKSTLLKIICGQQPYRGSIRIDGEECRDLSFKSRARKVAYLPQGIRSVNIDVETLVSHGRFCRHGSMRRMNEEDLAQIEGALQITGMDKYRQRNLQELSGGERQRAYLAMVIAQDAPMILLDEPTSSLDMAVQRDFYEILRRLAAEGHGIVMVCHNIEQSFSYSDRLCLLHKRTVAAQCTPDELAGKEELLREVFGAAFRRSDQEEALYPYYALR